MTNPIITFPLSESDKNTRFVKTIRNGIKKHIIVSDVSVVRTIFDSFAPDQRISFSFGVNRVVFKRSELFLKEIEFISGGSCRIDGVECNLLQVSKNEGYGNYKDFEKRFKDDIENETKKVLVVFNESNQNIYSI